MIRDNRLRSHAAGLLIDTTPVGAGKEVFCFPKIRTMAVGIDGPPISIIYTII